MSESDDDDRILNEPLDKQDVHRDFIRDYHNWVGATLTEWDNCHYNVDNCTPPNLAEVSVLLLSI